MVLCRGFLFYAILFAILNHISTSFVFCQVCYVLSNRTAPAGAETAISSQSGAGVKDPIRLLRQEVTEYRRQEIEARDAHSKKSPSYAKRG